MKASIASPKYCVMNSYAMVSSGVLWNMPRVTCIIRIYTHKHKACVYTKKIQVTSGISMVFNGKVLHN